MCDRKRLSKGSENSETHFRQGSFATPLAPYRPFDPTRDLSDPQPELMAHRILCWWAIIKNPSEIPDIKGKEIIKGHNLMDLAFFILKMYMSCTEIHVHIAPDRYTQIVCTG